VQPKKYDSAKKAPDDFFVQQNAPPQYNGYIAGGRGRRGGVAKILLDSPAAQTTEQV